MITRLLAIITLLTNPCRAFHPLVGSWKPAQKTPHDPITLHLSPDGTIRCVTPHAGCDVLCDARISDHDPNVLLINNIRATGWPSPRKVSWSDIRLFLAVRAACPIHVAVLHDKHDTAIVMWKFDGSTQSVTLQRIFSACDDK